MRRSKTWGLVLLAVPFGLAATASAAPDATSPRVVSVDLRSQAEDGAYYVVFFKRGPWPGHAFVGLGTEDPAAAQSKFKAFGLYPRDGLVAGAASYLVGEVPAKLIDEVRNGSLRAVTDQLICRVSRASYDAAERVRADWAASTAQGPEAEGGEGYELRRQDCVTFTAEVARAIALKVPPRSRGAFPQDLIDGLIRAAMERPSSPTAAPPPATAEPDVPAPPPGPGEGTPTQADTAPTSEATETRGDLRIRAVLFRRPLLPPEILAKLPRGRSNDWTIRLEVTNDSDTRKVEYKSGRKDASLTDDLGNEYRFDSVPVEPFAVSMFGYWTTPLYPHKTVVDTLIVEPAVERARSLRLRWPQWSVGLGNGTSADALTFDLRLGPSAPTAPTAPARPPAAEEPAPARSLKVVSVVNDSAVRAVFYVAAGSSAPRSAWAGPSTLEPHSANHFAVDSTMDVVLHFDRSEAAGFQDAAQVLDGAIVAKRASDLTALDGRWYAFVAVPGGWALRPTEPRSVASDPWLGTWTGRADDGSDVSVTVSSSAAGEYRASSRRTLATANGPLTVLGEFSGRVTGEYVLAMTAGFQTAALAGDATGERINRGGVSLTIRRDQKWVAPGDWVPLEAGQVFAKFEIENGSKAMTLTLRKTP